MQELLDRIMKEHESLPAAQRQVAAYVVNNAMQVPFLSITALAREIGVSDTTIIKFCNQLGFDGFGDFKKVFVDDVYSRLTMYNKIANNNTVSVKKGTIFDDVMCEDIENIQATLTNPTNLENMDKLIEMLQNTEEVYAVGARSSAVLSDFLASTLRYLGIKVHTLTGGVGDYLDRLFAVTPKDVVIAFSFPRYTGFIVDILKDLHQRGIKIVLITDTGLSPAYPYADLVFQCSVSTNGYLPTYCSCLSLIGVICRNASTALKHKAAQHVRDLESKLLEHGVLH